MVVLNGVFKERMIKVNIKPLSVNKAWQGKRFKTKDYKSFERELLLKMPMVKMVDSPFRVDLRFGFSNKLSDIDNPIKLTLDIIQKKYGINDRDVYALNVTKEVVKKGDEFIQYKITTL